MIEPFIVEQHLHSMHEWLKARESYIPPRDELPQIGYVVDKIAMGFLRRMEGGFAQIDSLVTNPIASPEDRDQALDLIYSTLIDTARSIGIKALMGFTTNKNTLTRSLRHGFTISDHTFLTKRL